MNLSKIKKIYLSVSALICFIALILLFLNPHSESIESSQKFPEVVGENLLGKSFNFPIDFLSQRILILCAYKQEQADVLSSWVRGLNLLGSEWEWYEMPVISKPYQIGSWIIEGGMRKGITDVRLQARVITLYMDREEFSRELGIPFDSEGAYAMVVEKDGHVVGYISGGFTSSGAQKIRNWMGL